MELTRQLPMEGFLDTFVLSSSGDAATRKLKTWLGVGLVCSVTKLTIVTPTFRLPLFVCVCVCVFVLFVCLFVCLFVFVCLCLFVRVFLSLPILSLPILSLPGVPILPSASLLPILPILHPPFSPVPILAKPCAFIWLVWLIQFQTKN